MKKTKLLILFLLAALLVSVWSPVPAYAQEFNAGPAKGTPLTINNKTYSSFKITFNGPVKYTLTLNRGKNKVFLQPGRYTYSYISCGIKTTGSLDVLATRISPLVITRCPRTQPHTFTFVNDTGGYVALSLMQVKGGTASYTFNLPTGSTKLTVNGGAYAYKMVGCGGRIRNGRIMIWGLKTWKVFCK